MTPGTWCRDGTGVVSVRGTGLLSLYGDPSPFWKRLPSRPAPFSRARYPVICLKLRAMAPRSTRATVGRIMRRRRSYWLWQPASPAASSSSRQMTDLPMAGGEVFETREFPHEGELDDAGRSVPLLADDDLRHALGVGRRLVPLAVQILAIDEHDDVGVLLEGARLAQIRQLRAVVGPRLRRAGQ